MQVKPASAGEQSGGVEPPAVLPVRIADHDRDTLRGVPNLPDSGGKILAQSCVKQQVLRRIAAQGQFRKRKQFGVGRPRLVDRFQNAGDVARHVSHQEVELRQGDLHGANEYG